MITGKEYLKKHIGETNIPEEYYENEIGEMMDWYADDYHQEQIKNLTIANVVKSLPNDDMVKAHIDTLPYYGTCTTEYNEGFEDGVKWLKEHLAK